MTIEKKIAYRFLILCLKDEVIRNSRPFSWFRAIHYGLKCADRRFYFWYRIWGYLYQTSTGKLHKFSMNKLMKLNKEYAIDISADAVIGEGLRIRHFPGIVIRPGCVIGKNLIIRQNTTIGVKNFNNEGIITIGDNVEIGANSVILGNLCIGSNVTIGAMSFIDKNIPDNHTAYTIKTNNVYLTKKHINNDKLSSLNDLKYT